MQAGSSLPGGRSFDRTVPDVSTRGGRLYSVKVLRYE